MTFKPAQLAEFCARLQAMNTSGELVRESAAREFPCGNKPKITRSRIPPAERKNVMSIREDWLRVRLQV